MRLDTSYLEYMTKDELRVLVAVELGMRNHEFVPAALIEKISKVKRANAYVILQNLLKNKLVQHVNKKYDGYKLTYLGYDFLALSSFYKRGTISQVLHKVGVGKESDIYKCKNADGHFVILKLGRLGRTSFRTVKNNRDYLKHRTHFNWLYMSRLAAVKEYAFMEILYKNGFPTPKPMDWSRHAIVMSLVDGFTLCNVEEIADAESVFKQCIDLLEKFAQHGLIHSDFNEFNLMITEQYKLIVIDFPQMVSTSHLNADYYFKRDLDCINTYFFRRFKCDATAHLDLASIEVIKRLDLEIKASGFVKSELHHKDDFNVLEELQQIKEDEEQQEDESEGDGQEESGESDDEQQIKQDMKQLQQNGDVEDDNDELDLEDNSNDDDFEVIDVDKPKKIHKKDMPKQQLQTQPPLQLNAEVGEVDTQYIKKVLKKKYRNKYQIKKNNNKNKEVDFEERLNDFFL